MASIAIIERKCTSCGKCASVCPFAAIEILEKKCGVPFGTNDVPKTIAGAYNMDGEALIEW